MTSTENFCAGMINIGVSTNLEIYKKKYIYWTLMLLLKEWGISNSYIMRGKTKSVLFGRTIFQNQFALMCFVLSWRCVCGSMIITSSLAVGPCMHLYALVCTWSNITFSRPAKNLIKMQEVNFWNSDIMVTHAAAPFSFLFNKVFLFSRKFDKSDAAALSQQLWIQMEQRSKVVWHRIGEKVKTSIPSRQRQWQSEIQWQTQTREEQNKDKNCKFKRSKEVKWCDAGLENRMKPELQFLFGPAPTDIVIS